MSDLTSYNTCYISSHIFATNVVANILAGEYIYAICFACLATTSMLYHSYSSTYVGMTHDQIRNRIWGLYVIDQIALFSVVLVGGVFVISKSKWNLLSAVVISTFLLVLYLYYYGYLTNQYCYDPNIQLAYRWHSMVHYISSIGHHLILFM